jgi:hypothetical protein
LSDVTVHGDLLERLIRHLYNPFSFSASAPKAVEVTAFRQESQKRIILNLINFQSQLPNIPVEDIEVSVQVDHAKRVLLLPQEQEIPFQATDGRITFKTRRLETFAMYAVEWE